MNKYDLIIVGAGSAGLTAGLYAARRGINTAIISKNIGGVANSIMLLENWPGFKGNGMELMKKFYEQVKSYKIDFIMDEVKEIKKQGEKFTMKADGKTFEAKALILATGVKRKDLKIPGEERLKGKGVSYCVTCDGYFFKNKVVAVIGGSDCAAISAIALTDIAKKVYVLYRGEYLRCEDVNSKRLEKNKKVEIVYNAIPLEIKGEDKVESIIIEENKKKREIKLDAVFVEIGSAPLIEFAKDLKLKLDKEEFIIVDKNMKTSVPGVFAAGDITNSDVKQVVVAAAEGAIAAKNSHEYLKKL
ncbi:MAG TPA: FAD-dependent oxidoreductase [Patescibacteria group bacterium]|nr:FAD-dependent oxidoreductase [Patescibacteria group bacterium]